MNLLFKTLAFLLMVIFFLGACNSDDTESMVFSVSDLRQEVHWHADFAVFINGKQIDFDAKHYITTEKFHVDEYVHIHDPFYGVVHVHREQTTWSEFFKTLGWELSERCFISDSEEYCSNGSKKLSFYVNGVQIDSITFLEISDLQRVLIRYGSQPNGLTQELDAIGTEACILSEICMDRMPETGAYPEPCSGRSSCN